jgi:hypothetical protein
MDTSESVIEEIRERRKQLSERFHHDLDAYFEYLKTLDEKYCVQVERYRQMFRVPVPETPKEE